MSTRLIDLVENLPRNRVVLLGDFMMDRYLYGNAERLSPEAPVPVLHFQNEEYRLGGAGNVAGGLAALNADVRVVGVMGDDEMSHKLTEHLRDCGCDTTGLVCCSGRPTTTKMRLVGSAQHRHPQQMLRLDFEQSSALSRADEDKLIASFTTAIAGASVVCIEDYNKGVVTERVCQEVIRIAKARGLPVLIDPANIPDYSKYTGATCIKLNRIETHKATGIRPSTPETCEAAAKVLIARLGLEAAIITMDKDGAYLGLYEGDTFVGEQLRTRARQVYDVTGAGDMVLAMLAVARAAGATWHEAVMLANVAGGLEVEKFGAIPIKPHEIVQELMSEAHEGLGKRRTLEQLLPELARHRGAGRRIVFTNGCFDLIHLGHVKYFRFAKAQGDLLVVGVNTDASIQRLKGSKRPIVNEDDRTEVLQELESIDYLVLFGEDTPINLIQAVRPDVLVKGADYAKTAVVGWDFVEAYGGKVALAPLIDGRSTSNVISRILDAYGGQK
ncbi:D-glycero-beta-D-manno-heptose 1-phosphate adenylyltransferase [Humisphaera borealis]|uniref:Bifunctional protein HldE n=1 Tax=Humisphaera borealis TaxID=2807512 RepID=A0A7M2X393_9BACT|nr:D-glycero-beta-D-manno-heptose 1-phosphate adenylyltransferase [Humisphaera borealis]QOV91491.1 D-glycero-beta-D-manno-heptose 1-phosphate adenylyltransferase [Humisphaera borealis]